MSKRNIVLFLLLTLLSTACNPQAPIPATGMVKEGTSTPEPTQQPLTTKTPRPTTEPAPLPSPTFTTDRIYIMGMGWADNDKEFKAEMVNISIQGNGLEQLDISLESNLDISIMVSIVPGTLFETISSSVQTMVARELREIILEPHAVVDIELEVACASMHLNTPGPGDSFTAVWPPTIPDLSKLVSSESFIEEENFRVQQFAIWVITDNPPSGNFVGLGSVGTGSGPSEDEMDQIRQLFLQAGVSMEEYRALK